MKIKLFFFLIFLVDMCHSVDKKLQTIYYQIARNEKSTSMEQKTECVIARFSVVKPNSSFQYSFQGIDTNLKKVVKFQGQLSPFSYVKHNMSCALMLPENGTIYTRKEKYLCLWRYDTVHFDWIFFTDASKTSLFVMSGHRTLTTEQQDRIDHYAQEWKQETNTTILYDSVTQNTCNHFTPP
jgi:hypothetical protein